MATGLEGSLSIWRWKKKEGGTVDFECLPWVPGTDVQMGRGVEMSKTWLPCTANSPSDAGDGRVSWRDATCCHQEDSRRHNPLFRSLTERELVARPQVEGAARSAESVQGRRPRERALQGEVWAGSRCTAGPRAAWRGSVAIGPGKYCTCLAPQINVNFSPFAVQPTWKNELAPSLGSYWPMFG